MEGGGSIGISPNLSGAFHTFSERYSANVFALMCFELSLPGILYRFTGRGVNDARMDLAVRHWCAEEP